jgi:hypothetical protein
MFCCLMTTVAIQLIVRPIHLPLVHVLKQSLNYFRSNPVAV